jgi:hypothetical protein
MGFNEWSEPFYDKRFVHGHAADDESDRHDGPEVEECGGSRSPGPWVSAGG